MKQFLLAVIIIITAIYLGGYISSIMFNNDSQRWVGDIIPSPSPSDYPKPTIKTQPAENEQTLIEAVEYKLKVRIPKNWQYSLNKDGVVYTYEKGTSIPHRGFLMLQAPDNSIKISFIPNFQGDYCSGAHDSVQEEITSRFGLTGKKTLCGNTYYLYERNSPYANLFISIAGEEDETVKEILSSIEYTP